jgi:STE24 endopeptidase
MRTLLKLALGIAVVAVTVAVVAQETKKEEPRSGDERFEVRITDEMIRHSRIRDVLYFVGTAWSFGVLYLLMKTGAVRRMRDVARRVSPRPFIVAMLTIAMALVAVTLLEFPLAYYSGFVVPHQFDLTDRSFGSWIGDVLKALAVNMAIMAPVGALAFYAIRRFRRWWLALWLGTIPFILVMVVIQPIVLDPIFNDFQPLKDQVLRTKLLNLASRAGIEHGRVYQVDKSRQTKTMNAYVTGIGPSARIVMWDTLLAKMTHDEVLGVMGHEMGHYVRKHIWKGLALSIAGAFFVYFAGQKIAERRNEDLGDSASLPWLALVFGGLAFLTTPFGTAFSRHIEHEADIFALELTHLNEPMATAFRKFAEDSKRDPSPHPLMEYWLYTHPPIAKRIPFALQYRPWEKGQPNQIIK